MSPSSPKPRGFYRIDFPAKKYLHYQSNCPFTFDYPDYAKPVLDTSKGSEPCWINLEFPQFNGTLHISYKAIESPKMYHQLTEDARDFAYKHSVKATDIEEFPINIPENRVGGIFYTIDGNTASSSQFYLTDTLHHYLRAALYFNEVPRADSIAPVIKFVNYDLQKMIKTFRWKNGYDSNL
jgi:gliding motility-associated lipoprotein GldD